MLEQIGELCLEIAKNMVFMLCQRSHILLSSHLFLSVLVDTYGSLLYILSIST